MQTRYSQEHHQNQFRHVGPEKEFREEQEQPLCPL